MNQMKQVLAALTASLVGLSFIPAHVAALETECDESETEIKENSSAMLGQVMAPEYEHGIISVDRVGIDGWYDIHAYADEGYQCVSLTAVNEAGEDVVQERYDSNIRFWPPGGDVFVEAEFIPIPGHVFLPETDHVYFKLSELRGTEGRSYSLYTECDEGYHLTSVTAEDEDGNNLVTRQYEDLSYTFFPFNEHSVSVHAEAAQDYIPYINEDGESQDCTKYINISALPDIENDIWGESGKSSWYVADKDATFENRPTIEGEVNIILKNGVTLNMIHGIRNRDGQTLNIYAQSSGETMGKLIAGSYSNQAGIGGNNEENNGAINIYGGNIYAKSESNGAGIGGGSQGNGGTIAINGGNIEAHGHLAIGHGKNSQGDESITLGDGVGMKGFNYEDRYDVLAIAQDAWVEPIDSTLPEVNYIDVDGKVKTLKDYRRLSTRPDMANDILDSGWYVVDKDAKFENRPTIQGEVNLLLCDGVTLNMVHGIRNREGQTLNIYAQSSGETMGKLIAGSYSNQAGIGGNDDESNGTIKICGGFINATGTHQGAGIGGGDNGNGGTVTIYGGDVCASAEYNPDYFTCGVGAGIGGGDNGNGGTVRIFGGKVYANSFHLDLSPFYDSWGAGIGGGDSGKGGIIAIYGGEIESHGYHAVGGGKDCKHGIHADTDLTIGNKMMVKGVDYSERSTVLSYGQDIFMYELDEIPVH